MSDQQQDNSQQQPQPTDDTNNQVEEIKLDDSQQDKNRLCKHRGSCIHSTLYTWARGLLIGYGLRASMALLSAIFIRRLYKNPRKLVNQTLLHKDPIGFGLFLAFYTGGFKGVNCLLRAIRQKEDGYNSAIAGFVAGASMMFSKSTEVALYLFARALESLFNAAWKRGYVKSWKHGDTALFCFCTSVMFYAFVWEPNTVRPSYLKFLSKVAGKDRDLSQVTSKIRELYYISNGIKPTAA
ncbi:hypothetical protein DFA_01754 [Cavenderia fasciculata]|uniref:Transmembrane protein n=1 Tax=Cavenderia fasciculata TaxID=261658 RepID=F4PUK4_CACFS|nr:uncharacterized protein DFA_01754 [Cavenderia fasciculata]EGG21868.1 hypothetical protein DFA_01754 [Cavenderia fasciculata]|eukprot:XP_004359719.1 hypothetical protein DFA_01754 [Cavenderia fasciculata]